MMTLHELKNAVDRLTVDELRELRAYVETRTAALPAEHPLPPEERIRRLDAAAHAIGEGFTDAECDESEQAMNEDYIEP